jgi:hypothetical protein
VVDEDLRSVVTFGAILKGSALKELALQLLIHCYNRTSFMAHRSYSAYRR